MPNNYKQGSITDKINQLKNNQIQKQNIQLAQPSSVTVNPNANVILPTTKPSNFEEYFATKKPVVPILPTKKAQNNVVPEITPENLNNLVSMPSVTSGAMPPKPVETKDDSDSNFLASLIGQGFAMMGAGIANRDPGQVGQQISQNRMSIDKFKSDEENRKQLNSERLDQIERAKKLLDPTSNESKQKRMTYGKALGIEIPETATAADLENGDFLRAMMQQNQMKLASMARGQGTGGGGSGKQSQSDKKTIEEYTEHVKSLASSANVMNSVQALDRQKLGSYFPDISNKTKLNASSIDREAQPQIKVLAGPGTITEGERASFLPMVTNSSMNRELAEQNTRNIILEGTNKALAKLKTDMNIGKISPKDYNTLINDYNEQLTKPILGISKIIDPNTGEIVERQKKQGKLNGKTIYFDQFGYRW